MLDEFGNELPPQEPQPHKFGQFNIPDDARLSLSRGLEVERSLRYLNFAPTNIGTFAKLSPKAK